MPFPSRHPSTLWMLLPLFALGCASPPPRPSGAVVPLEGGRYQSTVRAPDAQTALKVFTNDAEITCTKPDGKTRMPWEGKQAPGRYAVVSQSLKTKDGKEIKTDNKVLDAGIAVGLRKFGLEAPDAVEASTIFKCE